MNHKTNEKKTAFQTIDLVYIALAAVLIAICSWISIPTVIPFTMQTFAVFCVLSIFGGKRGTIAIIVYIILGAIGVPVFAEFTSGIGILLGTTGGYIVGFVFTGLIYWLAIRIFGKKLWVEVIALLIGLVVCYAFGTVWYMIIYARSNEAIGFATALAWCVLPFVIPDLVKLGLAMVLSRRVAPALRIGRKGL